MRCDTLQADVKQLVIGLRTQYVNFNEIRGSDSITLDWEAFLGTGSWIEADEKATINLSTLVSN